LQQTLAIGTTSIDTSINTQLREDIIVLQNYQFPKVFKNETTGAIALRMYEFDDDIKYQFYYTKDEALSTRTQTKNITHYTFDGNVYNPSKMLF